VPQAALTRFAPAPTGFLHLGHVVNAIFVWGVARATGGRVLLRIEDHDRQRSRPVFDVALLEDLAWLGFEADVGPVRQSEDERPYAAALETLSGKGLVYACDCSRTDMAGWSGAGCARGCRSRGLAWKARALRIALGGGDERWDDLLAGPRTAAVAARGDLPVRDRHGNWTYGFSVVVDDLRQDVGLVVRGEDLLPATASQVRLARALGRGASPVFLHHPLIRKPGGAKLSKADGDTSVRDLRLAGEPPETIIGRAASEVGLVAVQRDIDASDVAALVMR
jgi:glutamyl-tRNA synthetase/glutamyl-Q tRNA(Asp) synthetase